MGFTVQFGGVRKLTSPQPIKLLMMRHGLTNCGKWGLPPSTSGDMRDLRAQEELRRGSDKLCGRSHCHYGDVCCSYLLWVAAEIFSKHWFESEGLGNRICQFPDFNSCSDIKFLTMIY